MLSTNFIRTLLLCPALISKASFGWGVSVGITQRVLGENPGLHGVCYFLNARQWARWLPATPRSGAHHVTNAALTADNRAGRR
jgi:hypothetical protein